ncbi:MAG: hypothetical protein FWF41_05665 [Betaproteobacteria bacterium]|nr:hypothetical protein [Betaproteobacteria bacterium]
MHIIIAVLVAVAGLIWALTALQRSGVDLNSFNPFTWYRRHQWKKNFRAHPALTADNPMDIAAVVLLYTAELKGELTRETRQALLNIFQGTFKIDAKAAEELFSSTSFLLKDGLFEKHAARFVNERWSILSAEQSAQIISLVQQVAELDDAPTSQQNAFIALLKEKTQQPPGTSW